MRILCVDDDKTFLTLFQMTLKKHCQPDDDVLLADTGEAGKAILAEKKVDLLITDLVLPGISGIELLAAAKEINPTIEAIVITGQGSVDSAVEAMKLGARDYLQKPINTGLLIEKIDNVRELFLRRSEAEDYRFAKETIEDSCLKSVAEMEEKLDEYITLVDAIKSCGNGSDTPQQKVDTITGLIATHERKLAS